MKSLAWLIVAIMVPVVAGSGCSSPRLHVQTGDGSTPEAAMPAPDGGADQVSSGGLQVSPSSADFGSVPIGQASATVKIVVTNGGATATGSVAAVLSGPDAAQFAITSNACAGQLLTTGSSCEIGVAMMPTSTGAKSASLGVTASPGGSVSATLGGTAIPPGALAITPLAQDFGQVVSGQPSQPVTFTVKNTGQMMTGALGAAALSGSNATDFKIGSDLCAGQTLTVNGTCAIAVVFAPGSTGAKVASLTISGSPGGSTAASLTGTSVGGAAFTITPATHDFGAVLTGNTASQIFVLTNPGGQPTTAPTAAIAGTNAAELTLTANGCTAALPAGGSCMLTVQFAPTSAGAKSASLTITATTGGTATATLAGTGVQPGALHIAPVSAAFSSVLVGQASAAQVFTVSNSGGAATGALTASLSGSDAGQFAIAADTCSGAPLAGAATCTVSVAFRPSARGAKSASLLITGNPSEQVAATLSGTGQIGAQISISPPTGSFGSVAVGATGQQTFTVSNGGDLSSGTPAVTLVGADPAFMITTNGCTAAITGGKSCSVTVQFAPTTAGAKTGMLTVTATPGGTASAALSGAGLSPAVLSLTPATFDGGTVDVGSQSAPVTFVVTNTGMAASGVVALANTGSGATSFAITSDTCTGLQLAAGASCTVALVFKPTAFGAKSAMLGVSASPGASASATLTGTGRDTIQVTIAIAGTGTGTVTSSPAGTCVGSVCSYTRTTANPQVTFTATPAATSTFTSFGGVCASTTPTCTATLSASGTLTATFALATFTVTATPTLVGTGAGTIAFSPTGTSCGTGCNRYNAGTAVTLTATTTSGYFGGWGGDCAAASFGATCNISVTRNITATATFSSRVNRVFVTSQSFTLTQLANLGTLVGTTQTPAAKVLAGADSACATAAAASSALAGKYVAWLSSSEQSALSRIGTTARGWLRPDGKPFADSMQSLTTVNVVYYPPDVSEVGSASTGAVWTGTYPTGDPTTTDNCLDFASTAMTDIGTAGFREAGSEAWTNGFSQMCNAAASLYCFEVDFAVVVPQPAPPAPARPLFYTVSVFDSAAGLTAADTLCRNEAATNPAFAGLTFRALLATTTASITSRFTGRGVPIVRPDGVVLWNSDADFLAGAFPIAGPSVASDGVTYSGRASVWSGASTLTSAQTAGGGFTCSDWTANAPGSSNLGGISGQTAFSSRQAWFNEGTPVCSPSLGHLYCMQQ
jgi:hypothetical protein